MAIDTGKVLSRLEAKDLINRTDGKIFGVKFTKKNGEERVMSARLGVDSHKRGGSLRYEPNEKGLVPCWDMNVEGNGYRMIPLDRLEELQVNGLKYDVDPSQ
jgi:hypothetical protein